MMKKKIYIYILREREIDRERERERERETDRQTDRQTDRDEEEKENPRTDSLIWKKRNWWIIDYK